jgi:predicted small lipoprotein YifL
MFTVPQLFDINAAKPASNNLLKNATRSLCLVLLTSVLLLSLFGCGQKGELYLVDSSSQTLNGSAKVLDSSSNPKDVAFARIDDDYQETRYLEQKQLLPEVSNDPNDY